jgi:type II secretory pathway pseudopilin PulG
MIRSAIRGFTLLEALIATTLLLVLMGVMATIWQNAYRTADRTRSMLLAHQRARQAMDTADDMLLQRSGAMPLIAQDSGMSRRFPFKLGSWQSRVHMDGTSMDNGTTKASEAGLGLDLNGDGDKTDSIDEFWTDDPLTGNPGPKDPYSPGVQVKTAIIGEWGWSWGMGRRLLWHSDIMRLDVNRTAIDASKPTASWQYGQIDFSKDVNYIDNMTTGLTDSYYMDLMCRRYQNNVVTGLFDWRQSGPYRGATVLPWVHKDATGTQRPTPWLGQSHVYRVVSGPASFRQPDAKGVWRPQVTGDYGLTNAVPALPNSQTFANGKPLEPDWGFVTPGSWNPTSDPAIGTPQPEYGSTITDNGGVVWRCEAPHLMLWDSTRRSTVRTAGMVSSADINDNPGTWSTANLFRSAQMRNALVVRTGNPDIRDGTAPAAFKFDYNELISNVAVGNVSRFKIRTARRIVDWPATYAPTATAAATVARGRWGPLTIPGWWDGSGNVTGNPNGNGTWQGLNLGYPGAAPSGDELPCHPVWTSVEVGVVGGLDRNGSKAFNLLFTYALALR